MNNIFKYYIILCIIFSITVISNAQSTPKITEKTKMLIFTSIETDGAWVYTKEKDNWYKLLDNHYQYLEIKQTRPLIFTKPYITDSITRNYSIQLFKIESINSKKQAFYILKYTDNSNTAWLRVGGYVENDFNLLLNYLCKDGFKKRYLVFLLKSWERREDSFKDLNLQCKLKAYFKGKTNSNCFKSVFYILKNNSVFGGASKTLNSNNINSTFSKIPLYGSLQNSIILPKKKRMNKTWSEYKKKNK